MKAFSLWLFKLCWRREIEELAEISEATNLGIDYDDAWSAATDNCLETLHLKEPK